MQFANNDGFVLGTSCITEHPYYFNSLFFTKIIPLVVRDNKIVDLQIDKPIDKPNRNHQLQITKLFITKQTFSETRIILGLYREIELFKELQLALQ